MHIAVILAGLLLAWPAGAADADRGGRLWQARCFACHGLDAHRVGPKHRGLFGRQAGTAPGYAYSKALALSGIVWNEDALDRWLGDPSGFIPGSKMGFRVVDPDDRADLIAYLRSLEP